LPIHYTVCKPGIMVACEQALRGVLVAGRGKEWELATTSLEFEYLYRKNRCEMLIGGDDISNDVITLGACFHVFLNDIYLFGGSNDKAKVPTPFEDVYKLSMCK
ncbi:unnamed protein product, partial [Porites evermanni]